MQDEEIGAAAQVLDVDALYDRHGIILPEEAPMKLAIALTALALAASPAYAQDYPAKPVRVVVPFPSGGILELITRAVTDKVGASWGQPIIVEPRPGASGNIGIQLARNAPPDGYTLMMSAIFLAVNPALDVNSKFKTPISSASRSSE